MRRSVEVGGILVTPFGSMDEAVAAVIVPDGDVIPGFAVAINAEKVVRSQSDPDLRRSIQDATFCYADGMSVTWTLSKKGFPNKRIAGCDLWEALMQECGERGIPVFLLGAKPEVHRRTRAKLESRLGVRIVDSAHGYFDEDSEMIRRIADSGAKVVTVAMGSPRQEDFIRACRRVHEDAFYMGVGGGYDVYSGTASRAPRWMQDRGLEWLYRLLKQPSRLFRQTRLAKYLFMHTTGKL